jgi:hypothetical protein
MYSFWNSDVNPSFYVYIIPKETNILQIQIKKKKENG